MSSYFRNRRERREREEQERLREEQERLREEQERLCTHTFKTDELPAPKPPTRPTALDGHDDWVEAVAPLPDGSRVATACGDGFVRVFALGGGDDAPSRGELLVSIKAHEGWACAVCALGGDIIASAGWNDGVVSTWRASTGERVATLSVSKIFTHGMTKVGHSCVAVGARNEEGSWDLLFLSHNDGRDLREDTRVSTAHRDRITHIAVHANILVTTSWDETAAVWETGTREKLAVLRGHQKWVECAAVNDRVIATGSWDETVRIYRNGGDRLQTNKDRNKRKVDFSLISVLVGLHTTPIPALMLVGDNVLISGGDDKTLAFVDIAEGGSPAVLTRVNVGYRVDSAAILSDGNLAVGGPSGYAAVFSAPSAIREAVAAHAVDLFPTHPAHLSVADEILPPLQRAMIQVNAGVLGAGEACRDFVLKENCSESLSEWWCGHTLLITAVQNGEIAGEPHFDGSRLHWFEQLYTPEMPLPMGSADWIMVKNCLCKAQDAGVIVSADAALAYIMGRQDLMQEVSKLQDAGKDILSLMSRLLLEQAAADLRLQEFTSKFAALGERIGHLEMVNMLSSALQVIFSCVPFAGGALAGVVQGALTWGENVPELVESILGAVSGAAGAVTPGVLEKATNAPKLTDIFFTGAEALLSDEVWKDVPEEQRLLLRKSAEGMGMTWEEFCSMLREAVAQRKNNGSGGEGGGEGEGEGEDEDEDEEVGQPGDGEEVNNPEEGADLATSSELGSVENECASDTRGQLESAESVGSQGQAAVVTHDGGDLNELQVSEVGVASEAQAAGSAATDGSKYSSGVFKEAVVTANCDDSGNDSSGSESINNREEGDAYEGAGVGGELSNTAIATSSLRNDAEILSLTFEQLKVVSGDRDSVRLMRATGLARCLAAGMADFWSGLEENSRALEACLLRVLKACFMSGDALLDCYTEDTAFQVIVDEGLRQDAEYQTLRGTQVCEYRLRQVLAKLYSE